MRLVAGLRRAAAGVGIAALAALTVAVAVLGLPPSRAVFTATTTSPSNGFAVQTPDLRITTYEIPSGAFAGSSLILTLSHDLDADYFVMIQGAAEDAGLSPDWAPNDVFIRVDADPFTGNFTGAPAMAGNQIRLARTGSGGDWRGTVTVVESIGMSSTGGFRLLEVVETAMGSGTTSASHAMLQPWTDIGQVAAYGGQRGGGVTSSSAILAGFPTGWARISPAQDAIGVNERISLERQASVGGSLDGTATFSTYVVEWGSEWSIQRATVSGSAGGSGVDATSEYSTAAISPVTRANTFVVAYGHTASASTSAGWEGQVFALGDGVNQSATESRVAVGAETASGRTAEVYVHTHPDLRVDHVFASPGAARGIGALAKSGTVGVDAPGWTESYGASGTQATTADQRAAVVSNSLAAPLLGIPYPGPFVWARHTAAGELTWRRTRSGEAGELWVQSVDFGGVAS